MYVSLFASKWIFDVPLHLSNKMSSLKTGKYPECYDFCLLSASQTKLMYISLFASKWIFDVPLHLSNKMSSLKTGKYPLLSEHWSVICIKYRIQLPRSPKANQQNDIMHMKCFCWNMKRANKSRYYMAHIIYVNDFLFACIAWLCQGGFFSRQVS